MRTGYSDCTAASAGTGVSSLFDRREDADSRHLGGGAMILIRVKARRSSSTACNCV